MEPFSLKKIVAGIIILAVLGIGAFMIISSPQTKKTTEPTVIPVVAPVAPKTAEPKHNIIGSSAEGRAIESFTYGNGKTHLAFVGGVHGGYEWNSVLLAYKFLDYLDANPEAIPKNLTLTIIPSANPDGVYKVIRKEGRFTPADVPTGKEATVPGRFNARGIDLNRNFDCKWQPKSMWRGNEVSAGSAPFSEPEARVLRDFVLKNKPDAVIFWHSMSGAVYASQCKNGILPTTLDIMNAYAKAAGYAAIKKFDAYEVTGDSEGWLASVNIPAITVELKTHETIEWEENLAGIKSLFAYYGK